MYFFFLFVWLLFRHSITHMMNIIYLIRRLPNFNIRCDRQLTRVNVNCMSNMCLFSPPYISYDNSINRRITPAHSSFFTNYAFSITYVLRMHYIKTAAIFLLLLFNYRRHYHVHKFNNPNELFVIVR